MSYEFTAEIYAKVGSAQEGSLLSAAIVNALKGALDILDDGLASLHEDGKLYLYCAGDGLGPGDIEFLLKDLTLTQGIALTIIYEDRATFERGTLFVGPDRAQSEANYLVECIERHVGRLVALGVEESDNLGRRKVSLVKAMEDSKLDSFSFSKVISRYAERHGKPSSPPR